MELEQFRDMALESMNDGWIAVFEIDDREYIPKFQAADTKHATSRCNMYERPNIPFNVFE